MQNECVQFSPTGKSILLCCSNLAGNIWDGCIKTYTDVDSLARKRGPAATVKTEFGCPSAKWLDERTIISACDAGAINIWDWLGDGTLQNKKCLKEHNDLVLKLAISKDRNKVLSASADATVKIWDVCQGAHASVGRIQVPSCVNDADFCGSESGNIIASVSKDGFLNVWDMREATQPTMTTLLPEEPSCISFRAITQDFVIGTRVGNVICSDLRAGGNLKASIISQKDNINEITLNEKEDLVASASDDGSVCVYSFSRNSVVYHETKHSDFVRGLAFSPEETKDVTLLSAGWDSKVAVHSIKLDTNA
eukprot:m.341877 g.341877  ORF g.341877 m.341877 type:complete len:308 (+) comp20620_c0_seq1:179-1102(+)